MAKSKSRAKKRKQKLRESPTERLGRKLAQGPLGAMPMVIEPAGQVKMSAALEDFVEPADVLFADGYIGAQDERGLRVHGGQVGRDERHEHLPPLVRGEAIAALGEEPADAVLMDINFPPDVCNGGMGSWDGFQIMYWMRGLPTAKNTRFIMVSGSDSAAYRQQAKQLGAAAYFLKPLDHEQLFTAINAAN